MITYARSQALVFLNNSRTHLKKHYAGCRRNHHPRVTLGRVGGPSSEEEGGGRGKGEGGKGGLRGRETYADVTITVNDESVILRSLLTQ